MTVTARLDDSAIAVEPGQQAVVDLTVRNSGQRVEAYVLDLVGEPAAWASVRPAQLSVYPGDDAHAQVLFAPPKTAAIPAGYGRSASGWRRSTIPRTPPCRRGSSSCGRSPTSASS
jgi:hypothetical protein